MTDRPQSMLDAVTEIGNEIADPFQLEEFYFLGEEYCTTDCRFRSEYVDDSITQYCLNRSLRKLRLYAENNNLNIDLGQPFKFKNTSDGKGNSIQRVQCSIYKEEWDNELIFIEMTVYELASGIPFFSRKKTRVIAKIETGYFGEF